MAGSIEDYHADFADGERAICALLAETVEEHLPEAEAKVWHGHPVWFFDGNPTVGYSKQTRGIRLMFWSGAGFDEPRLNVPGRKFKDASIFYKSADEVDLSELERRLEKSRHIAWDYKNIVKRKGVLKRLTATTGES
ncbi:DUF1801 domain-containing protein [Sulfitobacter pontiacus]|uniref:DUF1801 domain-containing protein n=1 Tax=Sulfitobacter pontiacus TaxID=60137 RepID=UPI002764A54D|nr:DUF1801 domain-containing protein [Sulfitobacter pontiacus]GLO80023.1 hypothetical protein MACH23_34440 [Sulfitobacter pontiacus]